MKSDMQHDRAVNPHMSSNTSLDAGLSCWRTFFQEVINFSLEDVSANANAKKRLLLRNVCGPTLSAAVNEG
jgi:hypothetical protein